MSGEIIFANAAIQNRSFDVDQNPGKIAGIMVANVLNKLHDNPETIHTWNNVGTFAQTELEPPSKRLLAKYSSEPMQEHFDYWQLDDAGVDILTDVDDEFTSWARTVLEALIEKGQLVITRADFHACTACSTVIAEKSAPVNDCKGCGNCNLTTKNELALFVTLPEEKRSLLEKKNIFNAMNLRREQDALRQIPDRLLLSRDRAAGVDLSSFGLEGKVLDPRMGIGLLALYAAVKYDYGAVGIVQTTKTLIRTVPYIGGARVDLLDLPSLQYVPHTLIDTPYLRGGTFVDQVVAPLASVQQKQPVDQQRLGQALSQHEKLRRNIDALKEISKRLTPGEETGGSTGTIEIDTTQLEKLIAVLAKQAGLHIEHLKRLDTVRDDATTKTLQSAKQLIRFVDRLYSASSSS